MIGGNLLTDAAAPAPRPLARPEPPRFEAQVQRGLNLRLPLKTPAQMPAMLAVVKARQPEISAALASLNYVHFARFLPEPDGSALWVITTYDGPLQPYVMDFVSVLGPVFDELLQFIDRAPRLPVQRYAREFVAYVQAHDLPIGVWSAYPQATVIDILHAMERT